MSGTDNDEADEQWLAKNKEEIGKGTPKHFRWSKVMSDTLIGLLAREAVNGNKRSTTFKKKSLAKVAKEIREKFFLDCRPNHIVNHLKTVKKDWETITTLRNKSGFGWDDNLKMIIVDDNTYKREILANPNNEKYLNKTFEMFSEMALVFGKGVANGGNDTEYTEVESSMKDVDDDDDSASENSEDANARILALTETSKHFRWSRLMSNTLIGLLAREAVNGNRTASNFKKKSLIKVAKELREKFAFDIQPNHIVNHLRTVKKDWTTITTLRSKSGFGWDDNFKMIIVDDSTYKREILANPNNEKYLNKKIEMYSEMALVFGKRVTTKGNAKWSPSLSPSPDVALYHTEADSSMKDVNDDDDWKADKAAASSSIHVSEKRSHQKRRRDSEDANAGILALAAGVELVGQALLNLTKDRLMVKDLYYEVMKMEGYSEKILGKVFDYLVEHEMQAKGFMVKSENLRKMWIDSFLRKSGRTS